MTKGISRNWLRQARAFAYGEGRYNDAKKIRLWMRELLRQREMLRPTMRRRETP